MFINLILLLYIALKDNIIDSYALKGVGVWSTQTRFLFYYKMSALY